MTDPFGWGTAPQLDRFVIVTDEHGQSIAIRLNAVVAVLVRASSVVVDAANGKSYVIDKTDENLKPFGLLIKKAEDTKET